MEYYITDNPRRPIELIIDDKSYYYCIYEEIFFEYYDSKIQIEHIRKQPKASKIDLLLYGINNE